MKDCVAISTRTSSGAGITAGWGCGRHPVPATLQEEEEEEDKGMIVMMVVVVPVALQFAASFCDKSHRS